MPTNENEGLGELRADVRHIQSDVTDIKAELRERIEALDQRFERKLESLRKEMGEKIDKLD